MKYFNLKLKDYDLQFFYRPGNNLSTEKITKLKEDLEYVKNNYNSNLDFGIFSKKVDFNECLKNVMLSIFYLKEEPVGFFYNYLFQDGLDTISHQGLFVLNKNTGVDILNSVGVISSMLVFSQVGKFYITTLSSTPSVLEAIDDHVKEAWPSFKMNCQRPPSQYKKIFNIAMTKYQSLFLSEDEKIVIDEKRFKIRFENSNFDYPKNIFDFPLAKKIDYNVFYNFWIDYSKNEMVYLVGIYDEEIQNKNKEKINNIFNISI